MLTFDDLDLIPEIVRAVQDLGFRNPTPIQQRAIPYLLGTENDLVAFAQTGTGKTAAFSLPIIQKIISDSYEVQMLVLTPTRELCLQIAEDLRTFSKYLRDIETVAVYGGEHISIQIAALGNNPQIVVATPGRLNDLLNQEQIDLSTVRWLVLDEADEMLSMGFKKDLEDILYDIPEEKQSLLFSATRQRTIQDMMDNYLRNPYEIKLSPKDQVNTAIKHIYYSIGTNKKVLAIKRLIDLYEEMYAIIFCRTRKDTQELADKLMEDGYLAEALHGELSQSQRRRIMSRFKKQYISILVATDVAARGLDIDNLSHVINFMLPTDTETYIHRSGRTGRAGKKGMVISFISSNEEYLLERIEGDLGVEIERYGMPKGELVFQKQVFRAIRKIKKTKVKKYMLAPHKEEILQQLSKLDRDEIIERYLAIELGRTMVKNVLEDLEEKPMPNQNQDRTYTPSNGKYQLFKINLGSNQRLNPHRLIKLINKIIDKRNILLGKIEIQSDVTAFELENIHQEDLMSRYPGNRFNNFDVHIKVAEDVAS